MVLSLDRWRGKVAVVTGASVGIGASIAERLVEEGLIVVGLARRAEQIEEHAKKLSDKKGKLYAIKADISKEEDILNAFKWIADNVGPVSILINNAGVNKQTTLVDGDTKMWQQILDTNVLGLCVATREAIKVMKENKIGGHIIHINSVAGHIVPNIPYMSIYSASKHAVSALTETLRQELNHLGSKIKITSVSPGYVNSEIFQTNNFVLDEKVKGWLLNTVPSLNSEDITDGVAYALSTPPHVQVHELIIKPLGEAV